MIRDGVLTFVVDRVLKKGECRLQQKDYQTWAEVVVFGSKLLETVGMPGKVGIVAKSGIVEL